VDSERQRPPAASIGFAGLSSLVSNVDEVIVAAKQPGESRAAVGGSGTGASVTARRPQRSAVPSQSPPDTSSRLTLGSLAKICLGLLALLVVIWLIIPTPKQIVAPTAATVGVAPPSTAEIPSALPTASVEGPRIPSAPRPALAAPQALVQPRPNVLNARAGIAAERVPPIGSGLELNAGQIRYCLSEDIRLDAARNVVADAEIDRFNYMVADFNSRCARFQYRDGVFDPVKRQVEADRPRLELEGMLRFQR
jgi:hypothetical protein